MQYKLIIAVIMLGALCWLSQKAEANQSLSNRELAQYISSKIQTSLETKPASNYLHCDNQGCVVVVQ